MCGVCKCNAYDYTDKPGFYAIIKYFKDLTQTKKKEEFLKLERKTSHTDY